MLNAKVGEPCPYCLRIITKDVLAFKAKRKSERIKKALSIAKSLGEPVGRPREFDYATIVKLRREGKKLFQIADLMGCNVKTVSRILRRPR